MSASRWLSTASAPSFRAASSLARSRWSRWSGRRAAGRSERRQGHPPADTPDQNRLPRLSRARVVSIRHAVRVASEKLAAWGQGIAGGTRARLSAGTTMYSAAVPGQCSPSTRSVEQSESSPS